MKIGVQLFTLREQCKDLTSFSETLKRVADLGYRYVQVSGVCPYEPQWLQTELEKNGLVCAVTHISKDRLLSQPAQVAQEHDVFCCNNIGLGYHPFEQDGLQGQVEEFIQQFRPTAREIARLGKLFTYHHHDHEFQKLNGKTVLEHLADAFPPEQLGIIVDTFWVQAGGGDPAAWIEKFSGRVPIIHLKDFSYGKKMAVLGEGNINFDRVFEKAEAAKTQYMIVEQDDCNGEDPFACLEQSLRYLRALGFDQ